MTTRASCASICFLCHLWIFLLIYIHLLAIFTILGVLRSIRRRWGEWSLDSMTVKRCIGKQAKVTMGCKAIYITTWKKWFQNSLNSPFLCVIFTSQSFNFKEVIILMSFTTQCLWIATFGSNSLFGFRGSYFNHRLKNEDQILKHLIDKFVAERKSKKSIKIEPPHWQIFNILQYV